MILVDTNLWIDHLRAPNPRLLHYLRGRYVLSHPVVTGEVAVGSLADRRGTISFLLELPQAVTARHNEVLAYIERNNLGGRGIGYGDCHILAATRLSRRQFRQTWLWTRDKRLLAVAEELGLALADPME